VPGGQFIGAYLMINLTHILHAVYKSLDAL
jgi:hypothetical protein